MTARIIVLFIGVLVLGLRASGAEKFTSPAMLESMARHCIMPGLNLLAAGAAKLSRATQELEKTPDAKSLDKVQQAWRDLHLDFRRNRMLTRGPIGNSTSWAAMFFDVSPSAVENAIRKPDPINADFLAVLGASAKGFYAIEYLIFDALHGKGTIVGKANGVEQLNAKLLLEGPTADRRRLFVRAIALDLEQRLRAIASEAGAPGFSSKFSDGGKDAVDLMANQIIDGIEGGLVIPLIKYMTQLDAGRLRYDMIDGVNSGTSLSGISAAFDGVYRYYLGGDGLGIQDYVREVNPGLEKRMEQQFKTTAASLAKIKAPLEQAVLNDRPAVDQFIAEARKLERLCKVDVASALGITIMFATNDGD
jgi:uncharacterized protein